MEAQNHKLVIKSFDKFNKKFKNKYSLLICGKKFKDLWMILSN